MVGRPSDYSADIAELICSRIADGESLRSICADDDMPCKKTVLRWLNLHAEFGAQYTRAREVQADTLFDEMLEICDDGRNDWMSSNDGDENGGWKLNGEHVQRSRLRLDTRKWMAARLAPKKYSEKLDLNHSGQVEVREIVNRIVKPGDNG